MSHHKQRWTDEDVDKLVDMWVREVPIDEIAKTLVREAPTVRAKVSALRSKMPRLRKHLKLRTVFNGKPNYKLTAKQIPEIRKDTRTLRLIALDYKVSPVTIFKVKRRDTWKDIN